MTARRLNRPSPNFSRRGDAPISMLVMHYTGMRSAEEALSRLTDESAQVSAHYVVDEDGTIIQLVDEAHTAWHAGVSYWRGVQNVNPISIGIEIVNPGHEFGYRPFPSVQMESVATLSQEIIARHSISARNVVGHSDVAPERKEDPGELFDWKSLSAQGVGLWYIEQTFSNNFALFNTLTIKNKLLDFGYKIELNELYSPADEKVVIAFQRHFRPTQIDGLWDGECDAILAALLSIV